MILKKLWFWRNYSTNQHLYWWKKRRVDWGKDYFTPQHPHRKLLLQFLSLFSWYSLVELGAGAGANLQLIKDTFKGRKLCGIEPNEDAVAWARKNLSIEFRHGHAEDIFASDKSTEVIMTDMCLIYVGPLKIKKVLENIKKVAIGYVLLCEFHHTNWFKRQWLRVREGYHSYNYKKLLESLGYYDIIIHRLKPEDWPEAKDKQEFRHIILAKIPST